MCLWKNEGGIQYALTRFSYIGIICGKFLIQPLAVNKCVNQIAQKDAVLVSTVSESWVSPSQFLTSELFVSADRSGKLNPPGSHWMQMWLSAIVSYSVDNCLALICIWRLANGFLKSKPSLTMILWNLPGFRYFLPPKTFKCPSSASSFVFIFVHIRILSASLIWG